MQRNASDALSTGMSSGEILKSGTVRTVGRSTAAGSIPPSPARMINSAASTIRRVAPLET